MANESVRFEEQVVVITGAGGGLGRAYALAFAGRGARVVVNDISAEAAQRVVAEIEAAGGQAAPNADTVATVDGGAAVIASATDAFGRIDALVANAGVLRDRSFAKMTGEDFEAVLDVNLRGVFHVAQPAFKAMRDAGNGGRLVLTTSASGLFGNFGQSNYAAAKLGVVGLARTLSIEGVKNDILVNAVAPAAGTRLTTGADAGEASGQSPARVAPLVLALAHRSCRTTGEVFVAAGGWYARAFVALVEGWASDPQHNMPEDVLAHWEDIRGLKGLSEPTSARHIGEYIRRNVPDWDPAA